MAFYKWHSRWCITTGDYAIKIAIPWKFFERGKASNVSEYETQSECTMKVYRCINEWLITLCERCDMVEDWYIKFKKKRWWKSDNYVVEGDTSVWKSILTGHIVCVDYPDIFEII